MVFVGKRMWWLVDRRGSSCLSLEDEVRRFVSSERFCKWADGFTAIY
jgi:hypothetical protein